MSCLLQQNNKQYPIFGILSTETRNDNWNEIEMFLDSNLKEFICLK